MSTNVRFNLSEDIKITLKSQFWCENVKKLATYYETLYNVRHYIMLLNLYTTSGLSILLHGAISLPDATSCDKKDFNTLPSMKFQPPIKDKMLKKITFLALKMSPVVFIMLTNVKMPTIVGILSFMSMINVKFSEVEHEESFIFCSVQPAQLYRQARLLQICTQQDL